MIQADMYGMPVAELTQFVRRVALRCARRMPPHVQLDDLVSAGYVGLIEAGRRFDRACGEDFCAFAEFRVKGAIIDYLRNMDPLGRDRRKAVKEYGATVWRLANELGRAPDLEEVALELGLTAARSVSLAVMASDGGPASFDELLEGKRAGGIMDPTATDPYEAATRVELRERVASTVQTLPERMRTVILAYYFEGLKLREIGVRLNISESLVCLILGEARTLLRPMLADLVDDSSPESVH